MRGRILTAVAFALVAFSSTVLAEGPIVRWNRVEGVIGADLTEVRVGPITWVNSPLVVNPVPGSFIYQGFLELPTACRDHPEDLVFLIRHQEDAPPFYGAFMLYGAERDIQ